MQATIALADAILQEASGSLSVLKLGVTRLTVRQLPAQFIGAIVLLFTPEASDGEGGSSEFQIELVAPDGQSRVAIGEGRFPIKGARAQVVIGQRILVPIGAVGEHVLRLTCGSAVAETQLVVTQREATS